MAGNLQASGVNPLKRLSLVINKVTLSCNLNCSYCNRSDLPDDSASHKFMPLDTFRACADLVISKTREERIRWVFHGGEPLLIGLDWLESAMRYADRKASEIGIAISFGIQTNGILLDAEAASLFQRFGARLGVSIDGPPEINDKTRGKTDQLLQKLRMLQQMHIPFGAICVLSRYNVRKIREVLRFFSEIGLRSVKFNSCCEAGPNLPTRLDAEELFLARVAILDQMGHSSWAVSDDNLKRMLAKYFAEATSRLTAGSICGTLTCGAGRRVVCITPDGSFYPCGRSDNGLKMRLGSVHTGLDAQTWSEITGRFHDDRAGTEECGVCPAARICSFGCPAFERMDPDFLRRECQWTKMMYEYVRIYAAELRDTFNMVRRRHGLQRGRNPFLKGGVKMRKGMDVLHELRYVTVFKVDEKTLMKISFGKFGPLAGLCRRAVGPWLARMREAKVEYLVERVHPRSITLELKAKEAKEASLDQLRQLESWFCEEVYSVEPISRTRSLRPRGRRRPRRGRKTPPHSTLGQSNAGRRAKQNRLPASERPSSLAGCIK